MASGPFGTPLAIEPLNGAALKVHPVPSGLDLPSWQIVPYAARLLGTRDGFAQALLALRANRTIALACAGLYIRSHRGLFHRLALSEIVNWLALGKQGSGSLNLTPFF
jgi:hypothetical protein